MTIEEIFSKVAAHMVEGMMFHEQMCSYYAFLNLDGYQYCHKYHYLCETLSHREIQDFYIKKYNKMIPEAKVDSSSAIPANWYSYTRQAVDIQTKRNAVKTAFEKAIKWEKDTVALYRSFIAELEALHEYTSADELKIIVENVCDEIEHYEKEQLKLSSVDFNMLPIVQKQEHIKKIYRKKIKNLI